MTTAQRRTNGAVPFGFWSACVPVSFVMFAVVVALLSAFVIWSALAIGARSDPF